MTAALFLTALGGRLPGSVHMKWEHLYAVPVVRLEGERGLIHEYERATRQAIPPSRIRGYDKVSEPYRPNPSGAGDDYDSVRSTFALIRACRSPSRTVSSSTSRGMPVEGPSAVISMFTVSEAPTAASGLIAERRTSRT